MSLVAATADDQAAIRELLEASGLPTADLTPALLSGFFIQREGSNVVAVGGIEPVGGDALLRSVAVAPSHRERGLGRHIVQVLESSASERNCRRLFLLTTSAERYFERFGFERISRD